MSAKEKEFQEFLAWKAAHEGRTEPPEEEKATFKAKLSASGNRAKTFGALFKQVFVPDTAECTLSLSVTCTDEKAPPFQVSWNVLRNNQGFLLDVIPQVSLTSFTDTLPADFFKLLGADDESRIAKAVALLEQLEVFGVRGAAAAERARLKKEAEELKQKLESNKRKRQEVGAESQPVDDDTPPADDE